MLSHSSGVLKKKVTCDLEVWFPWFDVTWGLLASNIYLFSFFLSVYRMGLLAKDEDLIRNITTTG